MYQNAEGIAAPAGQPPVKAFPADGTHLSKILSDAQYRKSFHGQIKRFNPLMVGLYRIGLLPLFGTSRTVMLLTTRGKKSGKLRTTPIGYFRIGGIIYLFSAWGKGTGWYKNMQANPNHVWIQVGMLRWPVQAQPLEDPAGIKRVLEQFVTESPSQAKYVLGWEPGKDRMENADFSILIQRVLRIRFTDKRV